MNWIKEANKKGRYEKTYQGFRFYCTKESEVIETIFKRDGEDWKRTDITEAKYFAIDKTGLNYEGDYWFIVSKIDKEIMLRIMSKRCGEELFWK